jgi:16S rRNA G1207 methylase RsmC
VLPTIERKSKLKVLDYCSGADQIAAAVRAKAKKSRLWLLDADACALEAAKRNLSDDVEFILSDGWRALEKSDRAFDLILSNPPVHLGLAVDFVPIREFLAGLARRLRRPDGIAYFVAQRYVPVRAIAAGTTADTLKITRQGTDDAKFAVWKCVARGA